jgi:hypothetical protein
MTNCNNCKYFHGAHNIVCGVHPSGPEDRHCLDYVGVPVRKRLWRRTGLARRFVFGTGLSISVLSVCLAMASCFWVVARYLLMLPVSLSIFVQTLPYISGILGTIYVVFSEAFLFIEIFNAIVHRRRNHKNAIAKLSGFLVGAYFWVGFFLTFKP